MKGEARILSSTRILILRKIGCSRFRHKSALLHGAKEKGLLDRKSIWRIPSHEWDNNHDVLFVKKRPIEPIEFDAKIYLAIHKDVANAGVDPVHHYLMFGRKEGRCLR
jgi:hypothetical protein